MSDDPSTLLQDALEHLAHGRLEPALALLDRAIELDPNLPQGRSTARMMRALVHLQRSDFDAALADAQAHLQLHDADPAGWLALGRARAGQGKLEQARVAMDRALDLRPDWDDALWHRASTRAALRDLGGAVEDLDRALLHLAPHALGTGREARICEARAQLRLVAGDRTGAKGDMIRAAAVWDSRGRTDQRDRVIAMARELGL